MKEIGLQLKEKREENGVSVEEAAEDLKMRPSQITSIEEGNTEDFKDVLYLKYFVRDYSKYLGLDSEKVLDEFNEFLFDYTSKIPVEEIEEAKKNKKIKKEIASPYTVEEKKKIVPNYVLYIIVALVAIVIGYILISNVKGNDFKDSDITYAIRR